MTALEEFAELKRLPVDYLSKRRVANDSGGGLRFNYGDEARARIRKTPASSHPTFWARGDLRPMRALGHHLVTQFAKRHEKTLLIVEGESDTLTLWFHRRLALGVPGATMAHLLIGADVRWATRILIVREPGDAGFKFVESIGKRLREVGFAGEILEVSLAPFKDTSALHIGVGGDPKPFSDAIDAAVNNALVVNAKKERSVGAGSTTVLKFDDLAAKCTDEIDWAIDGLLRGSGILLLASQPKVGKSDTARNLAKAVRTGGEFLGRRCRKGKVLWIGLEEPVSHLRERIEVMGMQDLEIAFVIERPANVKDSSAWLRALVECQRPDLVIIDTIGRFADVEEINSYSDVTRATQPMIDLRMQYGTTFALLHHNNHSNRVLGSTMWEGFVDAILIITRNDDGTRFAYSKQRAGIEMEPTTLTLNQDTGEISCAESKFIADRRVAENRIVEMLKDEPMARRHELAQRCGRPATVGRAAVDSLVMAGVIKASGDGTKKSPRCYSLVSEFPQPLSTEREREREQTY
jgi:hypothetical protein